jgi:MoxR-like ATPase
MKMKFTGTENYIASHELSVAVEAAIQLAKPLVIKGEPGTGKTMLAFEIAKALDLQLYTWHVKSTTTAQQGLYEYDAVSRLRDSQFGDRDVSKIDQYIMRGKLWEAFESDQQVVLLIDEIDKADIEFPNDLLLELDRMEFYVYELKKTVKAIHRPIVIITSNNEKELPDAFLRRCFFHYIRFPEIDEMKEIIRVHYPEIRDTLLDRALTKFYQFREIPQLKKHPSTSELVDWIKLLILSNTTDDSLEEATIGDENFPFTGALLKNEQDHEFIRRYGNFGG